MEITPYVADLEAGMNFYYIPGEDGNFHQVPGQRIIIRPRVGHPEQKPLILAFVVIGKGKNHMKVSIIDEASGRAFFKPVTVTDEKFDDKELIPSIISHQVNNVLARADSFDALLKELAEKREKVIREYGPFPEGHGKPVN